MLLHSDFQNGSPPLSLFHRTFQIAADVGAAKTPVESGKIQTLAPGATAPEYRAQYPKTKIIGIIF